MEIRTEPNKYIGTTIRTLEDSTNFQDSEQVQGSGFSTEQILPDKKTMKRKITTFFNREELKKKLKDVVLSAIQDTSPISIQDKVL